MEEELSLTNTSSESAMIEVETARAIQEVQAAMIIAKKFPRDQNAAYNRIMTACERFSLADQAEYAYPRGGSTVTGPSIRLAEAIAQNWGNLQFGIRELSQSQGISEVEAFAWDLETNTRQIKTFQVEHKRYSKKKGMTILKDPRDIYEYVANQGARRMRACILGVIPGDIVEAAQKKCRSTVKKGMLEKPLIDQIRIVLKRLDSLGVTIEMIEKRLGHKTDKINEDELIELKNIGKSIQDNMTSRNEWFELNDESRMADTTKPATQGKPEYKVNDLSGDPEYDQSEAEKAQATLEAKRKQNSEGSIPKECPPFLLLLSAKGRSRFEHNGKLNSTGEIYLKEYEANQSLITEEIENLFPDEVKTAKERYTHAIEIKNKGKQPNSPQSPGADEQEKRTAAFIKWCKDAQSLAGKIDIVTPVLVARGYRAIDEVPEVDYPLVKKDIQGQLEDMGVEI